MNDLSYMKKALMLAKKGYGFVNPNPMVGAVIVKNNRVIGMGYHKKYGGLHAERNAIKACTESTEGATLYVTLEPCCHVGKTPPCTEAIIKSGIAKVVIGSVDPNPLVSGKGIEILKRNGIEVVSGVMDGENKRMNEVFFHYIKTNKPYVVMKYAMTADGKIATVTGASRWVTGEKARAQVHHLRHGYAGIMVGVDTIIRDDSMLNCRIANGKDGIRIICDTHLRIPLTSQVAQTANKIPTIIATGSEEREKIEALRGLGCRVMKIPVKKDHIDLEQLMQMLGEEKMDSILLEGGASLNFSALESGIVNKVQAYLSPKIFGGATAKTPVGGAGIKEPHQAFKLINTKFKRFGEDIMMEYEVVPCLRE